MTEEDIKLQYPGISNELVQQILSLHEGDPSHYAKQYEQGAYLRRFATGDSAHTGAGAIAQTIAGALSAKKDKEYADLLRGYQGKVTKARKNWWESRYPESVTGMPEQLSGPTEDMQGSSIGDAVY